MSESVSNDNVTQPSQLFFINGRYALGQLISRTQMSWVFKVWDCDRNCWVVIKIGYNNHEFRNSTLFLRREAIALTHLSKSPGIVRKIDSGYGVGSNEMFFVVLEYIKGERLDLLIDVARPSVGKSVSILEKALLTLQGIHDCGLVHSDIKPENMIFTPDKEVKILDFGLVRFANGFRSMNAILETPGHTFGTPSYMSPEQALGT